MTERLAINLMDLDRLAPIIYTNMIVPNVIKRSVQVGDTQDVAVEFSCDLLTAATICDNLRSDDRKAGDCPTRVYINYGTKWIKVPGDEVLTLVGSGSSVRLSPRLFKVPPAPAVPLPTRHLKIGRKV